MKMRKKAAIAVTILTFAVMAVSCGTFTEVKRTTTGDAKTESSDQKSQDKQPLVIADSGYTILPADSIGQVYATYAVALQNPNTKSVPSFWELTTTVKAPDGSVLGTEDQYIPSIAPGTTIYMSGDTVDCKGHTDAMMEFAVSGSEYDSVLASHKVSDKDFAADNVNFIDDEISPGVTGEITNNSDKDATNVVVYIVFKKGGKPVGGGMTYIQNLPKGGKAPFEYSMFSSVPEHDEIAVSAYSADW